MELVPFVRYLSISSGKLPDGIFSFLVNSVQWGRIRNSPAFLGSVHLGFCRHIEFWARKDS